MSDSESENITVKDIGDSISDIEILIGLEKLIILCREYGGMEIRFPKDEGCESFKELAALIGGESVKEIALHVGRGAVYIPMMSRFKKRMEHRKIIARYDELLRELGTGRKATMAVAKEFEKSERWVRTVVNR